MKTIAFLLSMLMLCNTAMATDYTADASCKGAWLFTEGSGTSVADASGEGNNGTFSGSVAWDTNDIPFATSGSAPNSADFTGGNIGCGTSTTLDVASGSAFSVCAMVYIDTTGGGGFGRIVDRLSGSTGFNFAVSSGGLQFNRGGSITQSSTLPSTGAWHHVCAISPAGTSQVVFYVDGVSVSKSSDPSVSFASGGSLTFMIGDRPSTGRAFDGKMTEIAYFSRELSSSEVAEIYNYGLKGSGSTPTRKRMIMMN